MICGWQLNLASSTGWKAHETKHFIVSIPEQKDPDYIVLVQGKSPASIFTVGKKEKNQFQLDVTSFIEQGNGHIFYCYYLVIRGLRNSGLSNFNIEATDKVLSDEGIEGPSL